MKAVVIAHGEVHETIARSCAALIVAADGGSRTLDRWGVLPHLIVGDLDSIERDRTIEYGSSGATIVSFPREKDESDLELAIRSALAPAPLG